MSVISNNDIGRAIYLVSKDQGHNEQFSSKVINFLVKRRLLSKSGDILRHLDKIIDTEEGRITAKVFSRVKINEHTKKEIIHILTKRYSVKEVTLLEIIDDKLLGGFKIEVNDEVMDLSIRNKINQLQEHLTRSV